MVVRDEEGAVGSDLHVDGAAPGLLVLEPAGREGLVRNGAAVLQTNEHDAVTHLVAAVPGAVFGDEDLVAVLGREHRARVEAHAERGDVSAELPLGWRELGARTL